VEEKENKMTHLFNTAPQTGTVARDPSAAGLSKPWSIKGIDEATVQLCKLAARGRGMKINRWVEEAVKYAAEAQLSADRSASLTTSSKDSAASGIPEEIFRRLAHLEGCVAAMRETQSAVISALSLAASQPR
jgi:hypothetical protein